MAKKASPQKSELSSPFYTVGLGASAGGLDALEKIFMHMPAPNGMAFVIVTHLDPTRDSLLPEILTKFTRMNIAVAKTGEALQPDHVYVIPPNKHLELHNGILQLTDPAQPRGQRHPIDQFLQSLARDQGEQAICVILSGTGSDGTLGLKAIKEHGGITIVQDEGSAQYSSMPLSAIATGMADLVLPVEAIAGKLLELIHYPPALSQSSPQPLPATELDDTLTKIFQLILKKSGQDFSQYKSNTILRRISRRMMFGNIETIGDYLQRLQRDPQEVAALMKDLLIGVTNFFRDPEAFKALEEKILPLLRAKPALGAFRVWVAGCCSGEEAYSITILLLELVNRCDKNIKIQVFATDLDQTAIEKARRGCYPPEISNDIDATRLRHFFTKEGNGYKVTSQVRESVVFAPHNLIKDPPFSKLDLICCRNLLIYLVPAIQNKLLPLFWYALNPGGLLFLGASETIGGNESLFVTLDKRWKIFQRRDGARPAALSFPLGLPPLFSADLKSPLKTTVSRAGLGTAVEAELLRRYAPPCVIINSSYEVVHFPTRANRYLQPPLGEPTLNLLSMVPDELRSQLRIVIRNAFNDQKKSQFNNLRFALDDVERFVTLSAEPFHDPAGERNLVMVTFEEQLDHSAAQSDAGRHPAGESGHGLALNHLEEELKTTRQQLRTTVEEAEAATEELKSSNEELMSMNEELQSTNEELETSKEELQALNEELVSVNSEIQGKALALEEINSDLVNLLESTQIATIFLDKKLQIKRFTPAAAQIFALLPGDIGRPLQHLTSKVQGRDLIADALQVLQTLEVLEQEVHCEDQRMFILRIRPYRTVNDVIDGVVFTFSDITAQKHNQQLAIDAQKFAEDIVATVRTPLLVLDAELRVITANPAFYQSYATDAEHTLGRCFFELAARIWDIPQLRKMLQDLLPRQREVVGFEISHQLADGEQRTIQLNASQIQQNSGLARNILLAIEDVTDRVSLDKYRQAKDRAEAANRAKSTFLSTVSHEIRTPLTITLSALELALNLKPDTQLRQLLDMAQSASLTLLQLIEDILDISKIEAGKIELEPTPFLLQKLVDDIVKFFSTMAAQKGLTLTTTIAPDLPAQIVSDPARLRQVLVNLIGNAIKFTHQGSVALHIRRSPDWSQPEIITLQFDISDTGIGIDADDIPLLFNSFTQLDSGCARRHGGSGLGLAISKKIIGLSGGSIWVTSQKNHGSTFSFTLPVLPVATLEGSNAVVTPPATLTAPPPATAPATTPPPASTILLVDDEPAIRELIGLFLRSRGWQLHSAATGHDAIALWQQQKFDLILLDLMMPGMDGLETAQTIRQLEKSSGKHIPIIALTAHAMREQSEKCLRHGMDDFLTKPINSAELFSKVEYYLRRNNSD